MIRHWSTPVGLCALWLVGACSPEQQDNTAAMPSQPAGGGTVAAEAPPPPDATPKGPESTSPQSPGPSGEEAGDDAVTPFATSDRDMVWKRYAALDAELSRALSLEPEALCTEFGNASCIREIHLVALGGNEPYRSGLTKPSVKTLSTTPTVVDRVLLSACSARAAADKTGPRVLFTELDLSGQAPAAQDPSVTATITTLFRKLLSRDPRTDEVAIIRGLLTTEDGSEALSAQEFAVLSCFVIGSSLEFLFI